MDLLSILRLMRRHLLIVVPIVLLTVAGGAYAVFFKPGLYETHASYVMLNPPEGKDSRANAFLRLPDPSALTGILASVMNSAGVAEDLKAQGADVRYTVKPSDAYGALSRILEVYAPGKSPAESQLTSDAVSKRLHIELKRLQDEEGVTKKGRITLLLLHADPEPKMRFSSTMRSLVAIGALGILAMFAALSVAQAVDQRKSEKAAKRAVVAPDSQEALQQAAVQ